MLLLLLLPFSSNATASSPLHTLLKQSEQQQLAQSPAWLALLHYRETLFGAGQQSEADDKNFFFSPQGRDNPKLELQATLSAMFSAPSDKPDQHPQCRFPARYHWLKQQLSITPQQLPPQPCNEFNDWLETINPGSATLIFPAAYLNSPSSMFGHTLLRINPADKRSETPLVAYALNYAAQMNDQDNGFVFAYKGIFGGYPGSFALVPYYEKIKEYSDMENRDIWEYQLDLNRDEVRQLMRHAWEVRKIRFDYYFFDENCSYRLLALLDVARPGLNLANQFPITAIPADTVRATEQANLYHDINYRPSTTTTLSHRLSLLDDSQQQQLLAVMTEASTHTSSDFLAQPEIEQARQLELGYDLLLYRIRGSGEKRDARTQHAYALLASRSKLNSSAQWPEPPTPKVRAEQGHLSSRLALSVGESQQQGFAALRYRPSYHDILDPSAGYGIGMQINFFDFNVRYYEDAQQLKLEELKIINILSLSPRNDFFKPISWGVDFGIQRQWLNGQEIHPLQVTAEAGASYRLSKQWRSAFMLQMQFAAHRAFPQQLNLGAGPAISLLYHSEQLHNLFSIRALNFPHDDSYHAWELDWQLNIPLKNQQGLRLSASRKQQDNYYLNEFELAWQWYF